MRSKHFSEKELSCPCCGNSTMSPSLLAMLDLLRNRVNMPLYINSAKRCDKHNVEVGGKSNSAHLTGNAVDLRALSGADRFKIISEAIAIGFRRIGIGKSFVHLDNSSTLPYPTLWSY